MNDRFIRLIEALHYSPSHFADEIGVIRSSISHILSGRNKPGVDLMQKVLLRFPEVSADWLLMGQGEMMKNAAPQAVSVPSAPAPQPQAAISPEPEPRTAVEMRQMTLDDYTTPQPDTKPQPAVNQIPPQPEASANPGPATESGLAQSLILESGSKVGIKRITVYFADNTFQDFIPG